MGKTKIEWTEYTWNPITGCSVVSAGCRHCYAMKLAGTRLQHHPSRAGLTIDTKEGPVWNGEVRFNEQWLRQPQQWRRPRRIFVCAHSDLFHENVKTEWIERILTVTLHAKHHVFQILTKRPDRMREVMQRWTDMNGRPQPNLWLGVSIEDQAAADERIPLLLKTPAAVRWISAEPLLGPVDIQPYMPNPLWNSLPSWKEPELDWIVCGGESGAKARPMHPEWARSLRDQCAAASVPFLFKQWGEWSPDDAGETPHADTVGILPSGDCAYYSKGYVAPFDTHERLEGAGWVRLDGRTLMDRIGKKRAGRLLDGVQHDGYPEIRP